MGGSKIQQIKLSFLQVVGEVGRVWIALHDAHLEYFTEGQFHEETAHLIPYLLWDLSLLESTDAYAL